METIGQSAFEDCYSLASIAFPSSLNSIGGYAFDNCFSITNISLAAGNTTFELFDCGSGKALVTGLNSEGKWTNNTVTVDDLVYGDITLDENNTDSLTNLHEYAFNGCILLTSIKLPEGLETIGDSAFVWCDSLVSITLPSSLTSIGDNVFCECFSLPSITLPSSLTTIGSFAFAGCEALTSITLPEGLETINEITFWDCNSLASITFPNSLTSIGNDAFGECTSLMEIHCIGEVNADLSVVNLNGNIGENAGTLYGDTQDHANGWKTKLGLTDWTASVKS